jgi:hypothetical protein
MKMMKYRSVFCSAMALLFAATGILAADVEPEAFMYGTGRYLRDKSDLVFRAKVNETPKRYSTEVGFIEYRLTLTPTTIYKQHPKYEQGSNLLVSIIHWDTSSQLPDLLTKGSDVIFFLKNTRPGGPDRIEWVSSDLWFALQPYNPVLEEIITRENK